jgi:phage tail sheath protein FI
MPVTPTFPGIYIQELASSTHTITASPTNIAVLIGYTHPLKTIPSNFNKAYEIFGLQDYQRQFGGFLQSAAFASAIDPLPNPPIPSADPSTSFGDMAQAVNQFFLNGGTQAYVVALQSQFLSSLVTQPPGDPSIPAGSVSGAQSPPVGPLTFWAREITDDTFQMTVKVTPVNPSPGSPPESTTADIVITYGPAQPPNATGPVSGTVIETYRQVNLKPGDPNYVTTRINGVSALVWVTVVAGSPPPGAFSAGTQTLPAWLHASQWTSIAAPDDFTNQMQQDTDLDKVSVFNIMVIPGVTNAFVLSNAVAFCERKRAFLVMDPPLNASADGTDPKFPTTIQTAATTLPTSTNAGLYFPYLQSPNPLTGLSTDPLTGNAYEIPPAATVAGVFATTDLSRGVWKAPAGFQATTNNTTGVAARGRMTDQRQGVLNPLGINCLRDFPNIGTAVFGARTTVTQTQEQWRYVSVRRMALFLEQTFYANLGWVVFEPNAQPLWSAITMSINSFMLGLFRQGAFQGDTPSQAFNVLCNSQTTTRADIDQGIVNIVVAFAPLKPAEFVIITLAQMAGQTQTS